jgi:hypothetical protein
MPIESEVSLPFFSNLEALGFGNESLSHNIWAFRDGKLQHVMTEYCIEAYKIPPGRELQK